MKNRIGFFTFFSISFVSWLFIFISLLISKYFGSNLLSWVLFNFLLFSLISTIFLSCKFLKLVNWFFIFSFPSSSGSIIFLFIFFFLYCSTKFSSFILYIISCFFSSSFSFLSSFSGLLIKNPFGFLLKFETLLTSFFSNLFISHFFSSSFFSISLLSIIGLTFTEILSLFFSSSLVICLLFVSLFFMYSILKVFSVLLFVNVFCFWSLYFSLNDLFFPMIKL